MRKYLLAFFLLLSVSVLNAQLRYPVTGIYKKAAPQGMAIWEDTAFLLGDGGICRIFDLKTGNVTGEFMLASADKDNHANTASFGVEVPEGGERPAVYISECKDRRRCFVENLFLDRSELVQTIEAFEDGKELRFFDWVVDRDGGFLYGLRTIAESVEGVGRVREIVKYRLPRLDEGREVILTEDDILERFKVAFGSITQGSKIRGRYLYIVTGVHETDNPVPDHKREIHIIDLRKKEIKKTVDLTYVTTNEPEDIAFYKNKALLYCGQTGGLYEIKL